MVFPCYLSIMWPKPVGRQTYGIAQPDFQHAVVVATNHHSAPIGAIFLLAPHGDTTEIPDINESHESCAIA
jgi:hypothetical protein